MKPEPQEKLQLSPQVIEQLNAMARNMPAPAAQGPQSPGPGPAPHIQRDQG